MSLLKLVIDLTAGNDDTETQESSSSSEAASAAAAAAEGQQVTDDAVPHADDGVTHAPAADVDVHDELQSADDVTIDDTNDDDDVIADSGYCFEDDVENVDYGADAADYMPAYKTDIQKGQ